MLPWGNMNPSGRDERAWGALVDPTRRRILDMLRERPRTTGQISAAFPQSRYAIMKHLSVLEEAGLLVVRRTGRERWNHINATPLRRIYERWLTPYQHLWASRLSQLGALVEGELQEPMIDSAQPAVRLVHIEQVLEIGGAPQVVFDALTTHVARWWSNVTYAVDGRPNLRIECHVGGRFFEVLGQDERLYATVTRYEPAKRLWLQGPMGLGGCVFGVITFDLQPCSAKSTELQLSHRMLGEVDDEAAAMYRAGWEVLLDKGLRAYVETGTEAWSAA
jgi:DNA-binding transcriptional ArsR family regulator